MIGLGATEFVLILIVVVAFIAYRAMSKQQAIRSAKRAAELSVVRNAVEEDVVAFGGRGRLRRGPVPAR
ncbi:MAG: hypothetical protein K0Q93_3166 [Nocardioidaceae bacterium]|nr:hypothetical protein [Nocardioidaceae bacterium]